jgi:Tfp pilus assembly protein PilZ
MRSQHEPRVPKRLPCDVNIGGVRHSGLVLNVSPRGLFVQTNAEARPGSEVSINLTPPSQREPVEVRATVVWKRTVPRQMLASDRGGMGLRIQDAPESYYTYLSGVLGGLGQDAPDKATARHAAPTPEASPLDLPAPRTPMAAPVSKELKFRVRVSQIVGSRSRYVSVTGSSPKHAGALALEEVGEGWQVLEVKLA